MSQMARAIFTCVKLVAQIEKTVLDTFYHLRKNCPNICFKQMIDLSNLFFPKKQRRISVENILETIKMNF